MGICGLGQEEAVRRRVTEMLESDCDVCFVGRRVAVGPFMGMVAAM